VYLEVPADAEPQRSGWSQKVDFSLTVVSQADKRYNNKWLPPSVTFTAQQSGQLTWGSTKLIALTALNDTTKGYIVNDTLIIKCDMTNICSGAALTVAAVPAAPAAPTAAQQRQTRIVDADTAAAAVISAAYPGTYLPAVAAVITAANPANAVSGAAPRVAVPAGLYPSGTGGLLYLPAGALANYSTV
jgi:hypothetical protein